MLTIVDTIHRTNMFFMKTLNINIMQMIIGIMAIIFFVTFSIWRYDCSMYRMDNNFDSPIYI